MGKVVHSSFRYDINGLRAWAVLAVIFFHFGLPGWAGGYVGVDVFFVISGYLMTGIIARALDDGAAARPARFMGAFFLARAKRIWPALLAMCALLLVAGWFVMSARELATLADQTASALLFYSNVKFWRETGYFAASAHGIWLLHTWSLSVEWQFYMLLPVAMVAAWRIRASRRTLIAVLATGALLSLGMCLYAARHSPGSAFFLLPCRAWEMIAGGLAALAVRQAPAWPAAWPSPPFRPTLPRLLELSGLGLIVLSILGFGHTAWPDWRAAVPVLGAVLVLVAARQDSVLTCSAPMQWIGTRSYSMYLWHWPLAVGLYYLEARNSPAAIGCALLLTALLGHLSYQWIETGLRRPVERLSAAAASLAMACACLAVILPARIISSEHGFAQRLPAAVDAMFQAAGDRLEADPRCQILANGHDRGCGAAGLPVAVIVVGDSHAGALFDAVERALPANAGAAMRWTMEGCPLMRGVRFAASASTDCARFNDWILNQAAKAYPGVPIVIVNRTSYYLEGANEDSDEDPVAPAIYFDQPRSSRSDDHYRQAAQRHVETACALARDRRVFMLRPIPEMGIDVPSASARALLFGARRDISLSVADYQRRHARTLAAQDQAHARCGIVLLDPLPYLCPDGRCDAVRGQHAMYFDDDHLSLHGARTLTPMLAAMFATPPGPGPGPSPGASPRSPALSGAARTF
ncbi:acyltransferase [Oxalobacteraceae bacterium OTU3CINTB1]|nr:acyltransferase [Oxalobacteraceae bacterium OTU3CINTB1]